MGELVKEIQNVTQEVLENKKGSWKDQLSFLCGAPGGARF